ncbi:Predicted O-methyltransferase YrrM [Cohnella sp. OV330]|uniref:O-methyltransferase n=1 Tax=Cohnella sp. OV330 TaxID=1855288 RepID=UPI0008EE3A0B|nr:O-methyltransferase [Cohnella sp. OV330]SFB33569.1 Predicted O-methyltransferase YrrM [Cohnella sp. OV330]
MTESREDGRAISPEAYFDGLFGEDADLVRVSESIRERGMPDISVAPGYGRLLTMLVAAARCRAVLEIGALAGYSGICLARGLADGGKLTSLELKPEYAELATANIAKAGYGDCAEMIVGDALASLDKLNAAGRRFDFFFIDADKENYPNYLERAIGLAAPGALIAADNTLLRGRTLNEAKQGPAVQAVRDFNRRLATDPRLLGTHLPSYDGLALFMVR